MEITPLFDARTWTLTYVVWDRDTRDAVVIDPVLDFDPATGRIWEESVERVMATVQAERLTVRAIFETHAHADHLTGAQALKRRTDAPVLVSSRIREVQAIFAPVFDLADFVADGRQFDGLLADGDVVAAGTLRVETIHTPGHTPACASYRVGDAVFTGDALFLPDSGVGRCDFPAGDAGALWDSVQRLYALPDTTRVFVGHDYQPGGRAVAWETTIGASKDANIHLRGDTAREAFVTFRKGRDATLAAPRLLLPSIQVNIDAGRLPKPRANGKRYLVTPLKVEA